MKKRLSLLLIIILIITSVLPIWAEEIPVVDVSEWAITTINEGERYGIYPMDWYFDNFTSDISKEKMEILLENTSRKLQELKLNENEEFIPIPTKGDTSRDDYLIGLYNILGLYDLPIGENYIEYFTERGILAGSFDGYDLDKVCTTEQAVVFSIRLIEDTFKQLDAGGKGFVWKVENNGNTIYLLGSIHIGSDIVYPLNHNLLNAYNESESLIVEANLFDQADGIDYFMEKSVYQDGTTIKDHISEELYEKVLEVLELYHIPAEQFTLLKPWSLANNLNVIRSSSSDSVEQGAQAANFGIDMYFLSKAILAEKPIVELEGIKFQTDLFDNLSPESQESYLASIVYDILEPTDDIIDSTTLVDDWLLQWKDGDIEEFSESFNKTMDSSEISLPETKEFESMLFGERDKNMASKIIKILESDKKGTYFVVVGAGHFVIEGTIIDNLIEKGYSVEIFN